MKLHSTNEDLKRLLFKANAEVSKPASSPMRKSLVRQSLTHSGLSPDLQMYTAYWSACCWYPEVHSVILITPTPLTHSIENQNFCISSRKCVWDLEAVSCCRISQLWLPAASCCYSHNFSNLVAPPVGEIVSSATDLFSIPICTTFAEFGHHGILHWRDTAVNK